MDVTVAVNLPPEVEERLRAESGGLSEAVREAFSVELFRRGLLTHRGLGEALNLDRFETDALLKRHQVLENSLTHEDVDADIWSINDLLSPPQT